MSTSENKSFPFIADAVIKPLVGPVPYITGIYATEYNENTKLDVFATVFNPVIGTIAGTWDLRVFVKIVYEIPESTTFEASSIVSNPPYNIKLYVFINL